MHNLCDQCETVAHCLTNGCIPLQPVWDTGPTNKDVEAALQSKRLAKLVAAPAAKSAPVPTSWMEMVTVNLLRKGVNKHTARELAEHFYRLHPFAAQPAPVQEPDYKNLFEQMCRQHDMVVDKLKAAQRQRVVFPTMLRKMWSGSEVQVWLDENVNKEKNNGQR